MEEAASPRAWDILRELATSFHSFRGYGFRLLLSHLQSPLSLASLAHVSARTYLRLRMILTEAIGLVSKLLQRNDDAHHTVYGFREI